MKIAITGRPGIGKTTLCLRVYDTLKDKLKISGFITQEERERGVRVGFKLIDLKSGFEARLARVGKGKINVGKYEVLLDEFENFLEKVDTSGELIIIDEVGPMELKSQKFITFVQELIKLERILLTVHYRAKHWIIEKIKRDFRLYTIDEGNRDKIFYEIVRIYDR
ncbi:MAG: NTPase [Archaeoglobaceae archaeon]|nr:NTPase [Archaeoglobaceae archaeon]